jgi:hypothetical protein
MTLLDIINKLIEGLPKIQKDNRSFEFFLEEEFNNYLSLLKNVDDTDVINMLKNVNIGIKTHSDLSKKRMINLIRKICKTISDVLKTYYEGYPSDAFLFIYDLLYNNKFSNNHKHSACKTANYYIKDTYINFFQFKVARIEERDWYRMRISPKKWDDIEEYFHLPFTLRGNSKSERFSIPGYPCLYLGTSLEVCWKEFSKPTDNIYASRFELQNKKKGIVLMDFTIPQKHKSIEDDNYFDIFSFLITYPMLLSCLIQVKNEENSFKPEYIIPQLVLQSIRNNFQSKKDDRLTYDGIIFSTTKDTKSKGDKFYNLVIPTKEFIKGKKFCEVTINTFHLTSPIKINSQKLDECETQLKSMNVNKLQQ